MPGMQETSFGQRSDLPTLRIRHSAFDSGKDSGNLNRK